ncbi:MAG TPA: protease inhibitor I42 family protein, partial [Candidatus Sulfotelmatobacter sp.]|nr:protease inhibitor I42 family protein [Candidatus Sulfotelmatobacter sp.]
MKARPVIAAILLSLQALAQAKNPKPMIVQVGRPFTLSLASNPTTGYHWQFATPLDEMHLKLLKAEYKKPESNWAGTEGTE